MLRKKCKIILHPNSWSPMFDRPTLDGSFLKKIYQSDWKALEILLTEGEIKEAVWGCGSNKILGPDDYSIIFIKKCWAFMKEDLVRCFMSFYTHAFLSRSCTSSF